MRMHIELEMMGEASRDQAVTLAINLSAHKSALIYAVLKF